MRARLEVLVLFVTLLVVAAFFGSFVADLRERRGGAGLDPAPIEADSGLQSALGEHPIRVEVLNAAGRSGIARRATASLRDQGFDVVYFGNAAAFDRDSSVVLDRTGDPAAAQAVARALRIRRLDSSPDEGLYLDATVLLGADWPPPDPEEDSGVTQTLGGWWEKLRSAF